MICVPKIKDVCIILFLLFFISCRNSVDKGYMVSQISCETDDYELGLLDKRGSFVKINSAEDYLTSVINGYYSIDDKLYKVNKGIHHSSCVVADGIEQTGIMSDGLIPVSRQFQNIQVLTEDGVNAFTLSEYCGQYVVGCYNYSDKKMRVRLTDGTSIFVDQSGHMLFDKKYTWATDFKKGYAVVQNEYQNSHLFSLIDENATTIFTFEGENGDDIVVSFDKRLLCAKEGERLIIYNFEGKRILECPKQVRGIQNFTADGFIYYNENDEYGLMSFDAKIIINAKYEQLVVNGTKYLALLNDEIDLITTSDRIIRRFLGQEIIDFSLWGADFPNIIVDENEHLTIIDESGDPIVCDIALEYIYDLTDHLYITSDYLPVDHIIREIVSFTNMDYGCSDRYGAFFSKEGHCHTRDVTFLNQMSTNSLMGCYEASKCIENGVNYDLSYNVFFDEPIVRHGNSILSTSAWLTRVEIDTKCSDYIKCSNLKKYIGENMRKSGCVLLLDKDNKHIYRSSTREILYGLVITKNRNNSFEYSVKLITMPNNGNSWNFLQSYTSI